MDTITNGIGSVVIFFSFIALIMSIHEGLTDAYLDRLGKVLYIIGSWITQIGITSMFTSQTFNTIYNVPQTYCLPLFLLGVALCAFARKTFFFIRSEMLDQRLLEIKTVEDERAERKKFVPCGELVNIHRAEKCTEIETTEKLLVVSGEVGSYSKGAQVFLNALGEITIGDQIKTPVYRLHGKLF